MAKLALLSAQEVDGANESEKVMPPLYHLLLGYPRTICHAPEHRPDLRVLTFSLYALPSYRSQSLSSVGGKEGAENGIKHIL